MKAIVLYSTKTGNTKMVAEAIAQALPGNTPCENIAAICQGKIDPKLLEMMYKQFPADNVHGKNPESVSRAKQASTHPDAEDLAAAAAFAKGVWSKADKLEC